MRDYVGRCINTYEQMIENESPVAIKKAGKIFRTIFIEIDVKNKIDIFQLEALYDEFGQNEMNEEED